MNSIGYQDKYDDLLSAIEHSELRGRTVNEREYIDLRYELELELLEFLEKTNQSESKEQAIAT